MTLIELFFRYLESQGEIRRSQRLIDLARKGRSVSLYLAPPHPAEGGDPASAIDTVPSSTPPLTPTSESDDAAGPTSSDSHTELLRLLDDLESSLPRQSYLGTRGFATALSASTLLSIKRFANTEHGRRLSALLASDSGAQRLVADLDEALSELNIAPGVAMDMALAQAGIPEGLSAFKVEKFLGAGDLTAAFVARHVNAVIGPRVVLKIFWKSWKEIFSSAEPDTSVLVDIRGYSGVLPYESLMREGRKAFLVMPYMPDGNLKQVLGDLSGSRRIGTAVRALGDVSDALKLTHQAGFVHGSVTAPNILLGQRQFFLADLYGPALRPAKGLSAQDDFLSLAGTFRDLLKDEWARLPHWFLRFIELCETELDKQPETESIVKKYVTRFVLPEHNRLLTLTAAWSVLQRRVHYDLKVGGEEDLKLFDCNAGLGRIRGLCALWHKIEELEWDDITREELAERLGSLLEKLRYVATRAIIGGDLYGSLQRHLPAPLWFVYDPSLAAIPWELLEIDGQRLCRHIPIARSPKLAQGAQRALGYRVMSTDRKLRVLLIADPSEDLPFARMECRRLLREFEGSSLADRLEVRVMDASCNLIQILEGIHESDVIHFAGHATFSEDDPETNALMLPSDERLDATELIDYWKGGRAPMLFFANACASARSPQASQTRFTHDVTMGLAQAFLAAGVASYVGPAWVVPDSQATVEFASSFYRRFFAGYCTGQAMMEARNECAERLGETDLTWARYVLYGHPFNRIDLGSGIPHERAVARDS